MIERMNAIFLSLPEPIQVLVTFFGGCHVLFFAIILLVTVLWLGLFSLPILGLAAVGWWGCVRLLRFYKGGADQPEEKASKKGESITIDTNRPDVVNVPARPRFPTEEEQDRIDEFERQGNIDGE